MIIALILTSLLAAGSIALNIFFGKKILAIYHAYKEMMFLEGEEDEIPQSAILNVYPHATLVCQMAISEDESSTQIYDTSLYMKNHVIGLTQFVQKQVLEQIAQELDVDIEDILDGADSGAVIEDCTVYQLKDGKWLWRPESFA